MSTHTVYRVSKRGSLDNLEKKTEQIPQPQADEVLVKVKSVSLNSRDIQVIDGRYPAQVKDSVTPCSDMAGEVVQIGDKVTAIQKGDSVVSNFRAKDVYNSAGGLTHSLGGDTDGCLAEYVCLNELAVNKINMPKDFSWHEAASLPCTGVTVWNSLYGLKPVKPGDVVLCIGTGGVALTALSIAKAAGAKTIITSSKDDKLARVKEEYGADLGINYVTNKDWDQEVLKLTNNKGADHILETGGNGTIEKSINCVAQDGIISLIGYMAPPPGERPDVFINSLIHSAILRGIRVGSKIHAEELIKFVENKGLRLAIDKVYKFHKGEVYDAFKMLDSGSQVGKICLDFE